MKKPVFLVLFALFVVQNQAQNIYFSDPIPCVGTSEAPFPYRPYFGTEEQTEAEEVNLWKFAEGNSFENSTGSAYAGWGFKAVDGTIVPYFGNSRAATSSIPKTIYSRCIAMEESKKYSLQLTFVGLTPGVSQNLEIYLANASKESYSNNDTFLIGKMSNLPFGETTASFIVDELPESTDDYRIAIRVAATPNIPAQSYFYLKNISFDEMKEYQLDMVSLNSPLSNCNLENQTVSFRIRNNGELTPQNFNVCYQYSSGSKISFETPVCQAFSNLTIPYAKDTILSFQTPQTFDSSATRMMAWVSYAEQPSVPDTLKDILILKTIPHDVPYVCSFDEPAIYNEWSVLPKSTMPSITWDMGGGVANIATNSVLSDDRLVSSCIALEKDTWYQISFTYQALSESNFESLRFYVGTNNTPNADDITLFDLPEFNTTDQRTVVTYFKPTQTRSYFLGFLAYSEDSREGIRIHDVAISKATTQTVPVYLGFEDYDNENGWQKLNSYAQSSGWETSSEAAYVFSGKRAAYSSASEKNDAWLVSQPLLLEENKTYEIAYNGKSLSGSQQLNTFVCEWSQIGTSSTPNWNQVFSSTDGYKTIKQYFTPSKTDLYFVAFQNKNAGAICLDDISIQDSMTAKDTNVSLASFSISDNFSACEIPVNENVTVTIKNRSPYSIPAHALSCIVESNGQVLTGESEPINTIAPYQSRDITMSVPMSNAGNYAVRFWISGNPNKNKNDDTSNVVNVQKISSLGVPYSMGFEAEEPSIWTIKRSQTPSAWWRFEHNNASLAHTGKGLAYLPPSGVLSSSSTQTIGSPCLSLEENKTYFISFLYKTGNENGSIRSTEMKVYAGTVTTTLEENLKKTVTVNNTEYERLSLYFRPKTTGTHYILIEGTSNSLASGISLDDFVIMDSVESQKPNLSLMQMQIDKGENCEKSSDTLYVEIKNDGFADYENPLVEIRFGGSVYPETISGTIEVDQSKIFRLKTLFAHENWGADSVRIQLVVQENRSKTRDTSFLVKSNKYEPITPPYEIAFDTDEVAGWNYLNAYEQPKTEFEHWVFSQNEEEPYAYFKNGTANQKNGLLVSGCLSLDLNETYLITYDYKGTSNLYPENLTVNYLSGAGTTETLATQNAILNTNYESKTVSLNPLGGNHERISFISQYNENAQGIYLNKFYIRVDTSAWPADLKIDSIQAPASGDMLTSSENIIISVSNIGRRPLKNIPIAYVLDNGEPVRDTLASLNPEETKMFTFKQKIDVSEYQTYTIRVFSELFDDQDRSSDTVEKIITNSPSSLQLQQKEITMNVYPNPATVEVFVQSDKMISTLQIHDMNGILISEFRVNNTQCLIKTGNLKSGMYLFSCMIEGQVVVQRVILKN